MRKSAVISSDFFLLFLPSYVYSFLSPLPPFYITLLFCFPSHLIKTTRKEAREGKGGEKRPPPSPSPKPEAIWIQGGCQQRLSRVGLSLLAVAGDTAPGIRNPGNWRLECIRTLRDRVSELTSLSPQMLLDCIGAPAAKSPSSSAAEEREQQRILYYREQRELYRLYRMEQARQQQQQALQQQQQQQQQQ